MNLTTRIDVAPDARQRVIAILQPRLSAVIELQLQFKHAHWNISGPAFIALHEMLDDLADQAAEAADILAERIVQLGGVAQGSSRAAAASGLPEAPDPPTVWRGHIEHLATATAKAAASVRQAIDQAAGAGDATSADVATEVSRALDKALWFLEAHLRGE